MGVGMNVWLHDYNTSHMCWGQSVATVALILVSARPVEYSAPRSVPQLS